ncbi:F0F1 ATP synthase subunit B family protein [Oecophyllibacter saccharovorans]|uniref:ATP synthase subunit b n=1 Tax=Oecophyllibacter saccharovorans TaxID=2558360 RepID=A0A506UKZ8_9PROT|nr:hypothetical protein [Oecophyllibacter saccharovorans]TPW34027.1 hypothetical protein E3202_05565 [Oecophyllibacter saccharovorans]
MRRLTPRTVLSVAAAVALPGQAMAEGMPQLQFSNPLVLGQVVWGAVIFIIFYLILSRSALPRMEDLLRNRRERIQNDLNLAHNAKDAAAAAHEDLVKAREEAAAHARAHVQAIRDTAREDARQKAEATQARLAENLRQAEERIGRSHREALTHLTEIATNAASAVTDRLIGHHDHHALREAVESASR